MSKQKLTGYPSVDKPWLKYYSEEALNTQPPECSIYQLLYQNNKDHKSDVALDYYGKIITYGELFQGIQRAEAGFRKFGVHEGDIVSAVAVNAPETLYAFYALNKIGAVSNWIDPRKGIEEVKKNITMVQSKLCLVQDIFLERLGEKLLAVPDVLFVLLSMKDSMPLPLKLLLSPKKSRSLKRKNIIKYADFVAGGSARPLEESVYKKDAPAVFEYTGGTTGIPKAVMLSNQNCNCSVIEYYISGVSIERTRTILTAAFPFTAYSMIGNQHLSLTMGLKCIQCFDLDIPKVAQLLRKKRCNYTANTPLLWESIAADKQLQKSDFSFLTVPIVGADTISIQSEQRVNDFLREHGCRSKLVKGYGMTETCAAVTLTPTNEINKLGSVGIPYRFMTISIFDLDTGEELSYGKQGEICITGPSVMLGYYQNEAATAEVLRLHPDGKKWIHSGDLGHMDQDGFLFIDGRIKRMIIDRVGFKIFAPNVESVISQVPEVEKCCVVGVKDKRYSIGQLAVAYVMSDGNQNEIKEKIYAICRNSLPEYCWPAEIYFIQEFPYTAAGKVDFRALEKLAEEES